ncbi:MAG: cell division protein FtsW [Clostridia bacterium]|nr:cell division protein FtsW [Clostridia bacterium]
MKKGGFFLRGARKLNNVYETELERRDPIYLEPLHRKSQDESKAPAAVKRGGIDVYFLIIVIALCMFGTVMVYSASAYTAELEFGDNLYYVKRHIIFIAVAMGLSAVFIALAKPWFWRFFSLGAYVGSAVLLLAVLVVGSDGNGAQRWIQIGPITIQPSEIAKMAIVMFLALIMSKFEKKIELSQRFGGHFRYGVLYPVLAIGLVCGLVMLEKHLSGLIIIGLLGLTIMILGGTDMKWMGLIGIAGVCAVAVVLLFSDYAQERVMTWLFLEKADPTGSAWQTWQGLYAIGSGGIFGVGLGNSRQKYGYVSEPQNDFIFTIICEELGLIGAMIVIVLFVLLLWRGYKIASRAPDKFLSLVAYGLTTKIALQTILNIAVVTNSMPNTGISLPFFSSGGTALVLQIFEMGIILSISRYATVKK